MAHANGTAYNMMPAHAMSIRMPTKLSGGASTTAAAKAADAAASSAAKTAKKTTNSLQKILDNLSKLFDWIEVRLDRLQRLESNYEAQSENQVGYGSKNASLNNAMDITKRQIEDTEAGMIRYEKQAEAVGKQVKLSSALIQKIQDGAIDIQSLSEDDKKKISAYKEWYDKALDCRDALEGLYKQQKDLQQQKLDNIIDQYETLANYSESIQKTSKSMSSYITATGSKAVNDSDFKQQLQNQMTEQSRITEYLRTEQAAYVKELAKAKDVFGETSNEYIEAKIKYEEMNAAIYESETALLEFKHEVYELDRTAIQYAIDKLKDFGDRLTSVVDLVVKRSGLTGIKEADYTRQIQNNNDMIERWEEKRKSYLDEIARNNWKEGSDEYEAARKNVEEATSNILSLASANEDLKDSIRELRWKPFNDLQTQLSNAIEAYDHLRGLMKDASLMDDKTAEFTGNGYAAIGLIGKSMYTAKQQIADYSKALEKLQEEYNNGIITLDELTEYSDEYLATIRSSVSAVEDYADALVELYEKRVTRENELLQESINKRKEALQAKANYYKYDDTIKSKTKDIQTLQSQIAAISGTTNQQAKAELARLKAQLKDAQDDLTDTVRDHEYEIRISGYDTLAEDANKALDDTLKAIEANAEKQQQIVDYMLNQIKGKYDEVYTSINTIIDNTGLKFSETASTGITDIYNLTQEKALGQAELFNTILENLRNTDEEAYNLIQQLAQDAGLTVNSSVEEQQVAFTNLLNNIQTNYTSVFDTIARVVESTGMRIVESAKTGVSAIQEINQASKNVSASAPASSTVTSSVDVNKSTNGSVASTVANAMSNQTVPEQQKQYEQQNKATNITISKGSASLQAGQTLALSASATPSGAAVRYVWASKNSGIATVSNGSVTAVSAGSTSITVTDEISGKSASCSITVTAPPAKEEPKPTVGSDKKDPQPAASVVAQKAANMRVSGVSPKLQSGSSGENVKKLQRALNDAGYKDNSGKKLQVDGVFGTKTKQAVMKFQKAMGIDANGVVGPNTKAKFKALGYKKGTTHAKNEWAWTQEDGAEMIIRKSDGAILTPLKAGDGVIPANLTQNLMEWGKMNPNSLMASYNMPKLGSDAYSTRTSNAQSINIHYDSLLTVNGNVDRDALPGLQELLKKSYEYTTKQMAKESRKLGMK